MTKKKSFSFRLSQKERKKIEIRRKVKVCSMNQQPTQDARRKKKNAGFFEKKRVIATGGGGGGGFSRTAESPQRKGALRLAK